MRVISPNVTTAGNDLVQPPPTVTQFSSTLLTLCIQIREVKRAKEIGDLKNHYHHRLASSQEEFSVLYSPLRKVNSGNTS